MYKNGNNTNRPGPKTKTNEKLISVYNEEASNKNKTPQKLAKFNKKLIVPDDDDENTTAEDSVPLIISNNIKKEPSSTHIT